jgi:hypothetical protein
MISIPCQPINPTPEGIFGDDVIEEGDAVNTQPVFGISSKALAGLDTYDRLEPPAPIRGKYVTLYFKHPGEVFDKLDWDIRAPKTDTIIWEFEVKSNVKGKVTISWTDITKQVPKGAKLTLTDLKTGQSLNMHERTNYTYLNSQPSEAAQFKITAKIAQIQQTLPEKTILM